MSTFAQGDVYQTSFDPKAYLKNFCSLGSGRDGILHFRLQQYHETFASGNVSGHTLIDIGSGPSIHQLISACEAFEEIIASDFTDANRHELEKWLKKEPGAFDWSPIVKAVCELEGDREKWLQKEEKLRKRVTRVLKCDVTQKYPLDPIVLPPADCLITSLCLETACKDYEAYCTAMKNITSLLRTGGHLVIVGVLGDTFYTVGGQTFFCLELDEDSVKKAVIGAGCTITKLKIFTTPENDHQSHLTDSYANFFLVACKDGAM
ncbi:nicotinamide N-methyltransferase-like [Lissotriton helveticus]